MKFVFTLLFILTGSCLPMSSCTDDAINNASSKPVEPGIYYINMSLSSEEKTTKGVIDNNRFDGNYDYSSIYLHKIVDAGEEERSIEIPVWNCPECDDKPGICFRICKYEDGTFDITPIGTDGEPIEDKKMTNFTGNDRFYFSSWPTDEWALDTTEGNSQITEGTVNGEATNLFHREKGINQEIYRSDPDIEYDLTDLVDGETITIVRGCAGFTVGGIFYDPENVDDEDPDDIIYDIEPSKFAEIMKSSYDEWFMKIYIGGESFSTQHNIATGTSTSDQTGYYSSGDGAKYSEENIDTQIYLPFTKRTYKSGATYKGYGYYTRTGEETAMGSSGNYLFTPVTGGQINVYILVKHWTKEDDPNGTKDNPSTEWLNSDKGALQTKVTLPTDALNPQNNYYYSIGLVMDLRDFEVAWNADGGDDWEDHQGTSSTVSTKSPSGATVRKFTLKDAKVICDVY